jgi:hypothetical protein
VPTRCRSVPVLCRSVPVPVLVLVTVPVLVLVTVTVTVLVTVTVTVLISAPGVGNGAGRCRSVPRSLKDRKKRCIIDLASTCKLPSCLFLLIIDLASTCKLILLDLKKNRLARSSTTSHTC